MKKKLVHLVNSISLKMAGQCDCKISYHEEINRKMVCTAFCEIKTNFKHWPNIGLQCYKNTLCECYEITLPKCYGTMQFSDVSARPSNI